MKRFLSIIFCLMLGLSSMFMLTACGEKEPEPIAEAIAMRTYEIAMENMNNEKAVKMTLNMMGVEAKTIISENKIYAYSTDSFEMWSTKNNDVYEIYTIENVGEDNNPEYQYVKSVYPAILMEEQSNFNLLMSMGETGMLEDDSSTIEFVSASELDGEITIKLKFKSNSWLEMEFNATFVIVNNKISSMTMNLFEI